MWVSHEQFRPNVVVDTEESYSEDNYQELRIGAALLRNAGPAVRCNTIRMNLDNHIRVDENEPYSELSTYRTVKDLGVVFGMFYQMEVLRNERVYNNALKAKTMGYATFDEGAKANPIQKHEGDGEYYVTVNKKDGLLVRHNEEMEWKSVRMNQKSVGKSDEK